MLHSPETLGGKTAPKWAWKSAQSFVRNEIKVWDRVLFSDTKLPDLLRDSVPIILLLGSNCQYFLLNHSSARQKREWAVNVSDSVPTTRILAVSLGGALSFAFIKKICMNYCCFIPHPTVLKTTPYMRVRCILVKKFKNPVKTTVQSLESNQETGFRALLWCWENTTTTQLCKRFRSMLYGGLITTSSQVNKSWLTSVFCQENKK